MRWATLGSKLGRRNRHCSVLQIVLTTKRPTQLVLCTEVRWQSCEAVQSPLSDVTNYWNTNSTPPLHLHGVETAKLA